MILGFTPDPFFECYSIVDERSAGFFALGLSQQSKKPTALVCTSGSALLNYYPAIAEAYYSRIPLVVISADRPPYKIDIGDGQTIRQTGVLEKHVGFHGGLFQDVVHATDSIRWEAGMQPETPADLKAMQQLRQGENEQLICRALQTAIQQRLPVHLNAPFEEPLYGTTDTAAIAPKPIHEVPSPHEEPDWEYLVSRWEKGSRKMIIIGAMPPGALHRKVLDRLAVDESVLVFTETTSNVHHPRFFSSIDSIMAPLECSREAGEHFRSLQPDLLLTIGGMVVSKKVKQFLRKYSPRTHWHVDPNQSPDTYYCLERHIRMEAGAFLDSFLKKVNPAKKGYLTHWLQFRSAYEEKREEYLRQAPFSDMTAFARILSAIPSGTQVQLANSSTIRYTQLFDMLPDNPVYCNRGTSGIEGASSTAVGAAVNSDKPVLLISGDLSFSYDSNAFWNRYLRPDFRIIVINNQGGGIFRILPGKEEDTTFETYFETVQEGSLRHICKHYGIGYAAASNEAELTDQLDVFFAPSGTPRLLEVITPRKLNDGVLLGYFDFLSSALLQTTDQNKRDE